jgi:hypothetical protein
MTISCIICKLPRLRVLLNRDGNFENGFFNKIEMKTSYLKVLFLTLAHVLVFTFGTTVAWAYLRDVYSWPVTTVNYHINSAFAASFLTAMQVSDASWDAAGSRFRFNYLGTTTRNPNVFGTYSDDGYSDIGNYNAGQNGIMAITLGWVMPPLSFSISERDTTFNTFYHFTTVGTAGYYDVQNTMTHEFGHWLKLLDVFSAGSPTNCGSLGESTECGYTTPNETRKRSLEIDDKNGIIAIYGV